VAILKFGHRYPDLACAMLKALGDGVLPIIEIEETRIVARATALAEEFIEDKRREHARIKSETGNADSGFFSPLMLTARYHSGSLQIIWKEMHRIKNKSGEGHWIKHVAVKKGRYGGYPIARLQKSAGYAAGIVEEYELNAAELREGWQQLMRVKKDIYAAIRRLPALDAASAPAASPASQPSAEPAIIDTLVPKPEPPPIPSPDKPRTRPPARRL